MIVNRPLRVFLFLAMGVLAVAPMAHSKGIGGCDAFTWDLSHEFEILRGPAQSIAANENIQQSAMPLQLDQHYVISLFPQNTVGFVVPPGREARDPDPHGGIAYFHVEESGRYRIAIDTGHWIDVIDAGSNVLDPAVAHVVVSTAHEGQSGCTALHKVVVFDLEGGKTYQLHFSGRSAKRLDAVVTREAAEVGDKTR